MAVQAGMRITAEEYYQLPEYQEHDLIQLIDGEVIIGVAPIPRHQTIVGEILVLLTLYARQHGGSAYPAPVEVYLDEYNIFEPDVLYLAPESRCVVEEKRLVGPPDLVAEVLSPSTAKHDREQKFRAYQTHGVGEYWIVDPANLYIEVWTLEAGAFVKLGTFAGSDTFDSPVLNGQAVAVSELLRE
jgi:Uma2 family endonuclease